MITFIYLFLVKKCKETGSLQDCVSATRYCSKYLEKIYRHSGRRFYDVRYTNITFYNYVRFIKQDHVKNLLGIPQNRHYHMCNIRVVMSNMLFFFFIDYIIISIFIHSYLFYLFIYLEKSILQYGWFVSFINKFYLSIYLSIYLYIVYFYYNSARDFSPFVSNLLNQDIRVLLFAGDADYRGNWVR